MRFSFLSVPVALICFAIFSPLFAQQADIRIARAKRVDTVPIVDGDLMDPVWQAAEPIDNFIQAEPAEGREATERTEVRIVYTDEMLYIAVMCFDSQPEGILVTDSRRDSDLSETDSFQVILDTYHDLQNGFVFGTNPAGIEYDGQVSNEGLGGGGAGGGFNRNWDGTWQVSSRILDNGWSAEFAIPLRTLRYASAKPQVWGLNFNRNIRRKRELVYWSPVSRVYNINRLSSAGELHGLELESPRNFKFTPYVVGTALRDYRAPVNGAVRTVRQGDAGFDVKFGLTPSLNLDATYNTDFAQVEVDEQQINLTRFNLFFPEKRPFFLENAGTFAVGRAESIDLFFSRRIGIDQNNGLVPIVAGSRLSGKAGNFNVGFLNMQTKSVSSFMQGETKITPANNFTVGRVSRELPNRSALGAIFVNRSSTGSAASSDNWNRTWGVDGKLGVGENLTFNGFAARTETPGRTGRESAFNLRGEYQKSGGRTWIEIAEVGRDFNPEVGFLERRNYRHVSTGVFKNIRPNISWLRELRPHASYNGYWDLRGFLATERIHIDSHIDFENGYYISPPLDLVTEGLREPFEIYPGIVVPPGVYRNAVFAGRFNTDQRALLSFSAETDVGGFLSGSQKSFGATVAGRRGSKVNSSIRWRRNNIYLPQGDFKTNLIQWRFNYSITPLMYAQSLIQYNDRINSWSSNIRFGWLSRAGTGLFLVYNEGQELDGLGPISRSFIVKYAKQFDLFN
jgi:hypothetical protein